MNISAGLRLLCLGFRLKNDMKKHRGCTVFKRISDLGIGLASLGFVIVNLSFWLVPVIICATGKRLIPVKSVDAFTSKIMDRIYHLAVTVNDWLFFSVLKNRIVFDAGYERDESGEKEDCLVLANHRSWVDILILQSLLNKRRAPIQFIVKRELLYMPLIGMICWAYGCPFVHRSSLKPDRKKDRRAGKDFQKIAVNLEKSASSALCLINFVEGTRFSLFKMKKYTSPYRHLLNPRVGGLHYILKHYGKRLQAVWDFTIVYDVAEPVFWKFLSGRCGQIRIDLVKIPMVSLIRKLGTDFADIEVSQVGIWIKALWQEKDLKIEKMLALTDGVKTR
jgi:1-acyl-sn-glycerol-3-phosphate acyltransferase